LDDIKISCKLDNYSPEDALTEIIKEFPLSYKLYNNSAVLYKVVKREKTVKKPIVVKERVAETTVNSELIKPKLLTKVQPDYPPVAARSNIKGNVTVNLFINFEGIVKKVKMEDSSGSEILDSATIAYSEKLKFLPAQVNGNPQSVWMKMTFRYFFTSNENTTYN